MKSKILKIVLGLILFSALFITVSSAYESAPGRSFKVLYRGVNIDELGNISGLGLDTITVKG